MKPFAVIVAAAVLAFAPVSVTAQSSNAAAYLMDQEVRAACNGAGRIAPEAFIERDLTGDGRDDLIVAHEGITCSNGRRSGYCGMQVCSVHIYVREGDLLRRKVEVLGGGLSVGKGAVPRISMHAHGGAQRQMQWNGRSFAAP